MNAFPLTPQKCLVHFFPPYRITRPAARIRNRGKCVHIYSKRAGANPIAINNNDSSRADTARPVAVMLVFPPGTGSKTSGHTAGVLPQHARYLFF